MNESMSLNSFINFCDEMWIPAEEATIKMPMSIKKIIVAIEQFFAKAYGVIQRFIMNLRKIGKYRTTKEYADAINETGVRLETLFFNMNTSQDTDYGAIARFKDEFIEIINSPKYSIVMNNEFDEDDVIELDSRMAIARMQKASKDVEYAKKMVAASKLMSDDNSSNTKLDFYKLMTNVMTEQLKVYSKYFSKGFYRNTENPNIMKLDEGIEVDHVS